MCAFLPAFGAVEVGRGVKTRDRALSTAPPLATPAIYIYIYIYICIFIIIIMMMMMMMMMMMIIKLIMIS